MIPAAIDAKWLGHLGVTSTSAVPPGMSGAVVYRCESQDRCYALKRWPAATGPERIEAIHRVMIAARESGCDLVPRLHRSVDGGRHTSCLVADHHCWDLVEWMPGAALPVDAGPVLLTRGAVAISRFHAGVRALGQHRQVAPAVRDRVVRLHELRPIIDDVLSLTSLPPLPAPLEAPIHRTWQRLQLQWRQLLPRLIETLQPMTDREVTTQFVLRDVHRHHILFAEDQPTGLIDFDAIRIDTPAADLARWVGSFRAVPDSFWDSLLADQRPECPSDYRRFTEPDIAMAQALYRVNPWIGLANWLVWIVAERRSFAASPAAIASRIDELGSAAEPEI